ncbi:MAG: hypothetical protein F4Z77_04405 [Dehalococcoidia bacterium]|nr:hypothetical protein [Dehalococcoidia bacterium]MYA54423.1 hypothetical protein [Dehalococcoidia bacterium]
MSAAGELPRLLAEMPFLDRLEAVALSGWSRGAVYPAMAALEEEGLAASLPHASGLIAPTRRYALTASGVGRLAGEAGLAVEDALRAWPVSARARRVLLERLDAVAVLYRLAAAIAGAAWPLRYRWYRAGPVDAALALPGERTLALVRQGPATERTAFAKRLWRLREGPRFGAFLLLAPDAVRLRGLARRMRAAKAITFLALERDAAAAGASARIWRTASGSPALSLDEVLALVGPGDAWPEGRPLARVALPAPLPHAGGGGAPPWMLPYRLTPAEKRLLDALARWPWIAREHLGALLGLGRTRLSGLLHRLEGLGLVRAHGPDGRLALSEDALTLLARRDRAAAADARRRWSAEPFDPEAPLTWRNVRGRRSRQLLRNLAHTSAVHGFLAVLAEQARAEGREVVQLDPPHRASRYFRHDGALHSVHPDAFGLLRREGKPWAFFLEWERRAVRPSTMAARFAPYLRYYASQRPTDDHGLRPDVLVVFEDELAAHHFLGVARREIARGGVDLPILVSHRALIEREGPLGRGWAAVAGGAARPFPDERAPRPFGDAAG